MSQPTTVLLSQADLQLIEVSQLGSPLGVYKVKPRYTNFLQWSRRIICVLGIATLALTIMTSLRDWRQALTVDPKQVESYWEFLISTNYFVTTACNVIAVVLFWTLLTYIVLPQARYAHVIVCEQGLLHMRRRIRGEHIEVVRWTDIPALGNKYVGGAYFLTYMDGARHKTLVLSDTYQDLAGLVVLIKQQYHSENDQE